MSNNDLQKDDKVVGVVEELRSDEDIDHVDFEDFRDIAYNDPLVEANPNPESIPEEVQRVLWLRAPPPDLTQKKRFGSIRGEFSGQIRSWDFDEQNNLVLVKRTDGFQYFKPRFKNLCTLPAHDLHHIAQLDVNTPISNRLNWSIEEGSRRIEQIKQVEPFQACCGPACQN
ncbi:hypothetical protein Hanom_Chr16g01467481 [Helianthus anomalus]